MSVISWSPGGFVYQEDDVDCTVISRVATVDHFWFLVDVRLWRGQPFGNWLNIMTIYREARLWNGTLVYNETRLHKE